MMRALIPCLLVACGGGGLEGRVVDVMHGNAPLAGETLVARAVNSVRMTCQQLTGVTDADGRFTIDGLCLSETAYELRTTNDNLLLVGTTEVSAPGEIVLEAWWAPKGDGTYLLRADGLSPLKTHADLKKRTITGTEHEILYPATLPDPMPSLGASEHLVLTGADSVANTRIAPLVQSDARTFGETSVEPWWYVGVRFLTDTEVEPVEAAPSLDRVREVTEGGRTARFIAGDALPPGSYVLYRDGGRRASVVRFGD